MKQVKFIKHYAPYNAGETAAFPPHDADRLVLKLRVAEFVNAEDYPADKRIVAQQAVSREDEDDEETTLTPEEIEAAARKAAEEDEARRNDQLPKLEEMTKADLIKLADEKLNLELHPALTKAQMIEAIQLEVAELQKQEENEEEEDESANGGNE